MCVALHSTPWPELTDQRIRTHCRMLIKRRRRKCTISNEPSTLAAACPHPPPHPLAPTLPSDHAHPALAVGLARFKMNSYMSSTNKPMVRRRQSDADSVCTFRSPALLGASPCPRPLALATAGPPRQVGTIPFIAPECFENAPISEKADVFSLAVIIWVSRFRGAERDRTRALPAA